MELERSWKKKEMTPVLSVKQTLRRKQYYYCSKKRLRTPQFCTRTYIYSNNIDLSNVCRRLMAHSSTPHCSLSARVSYIPFVASQVSGEANKLCKQPWAHDVIVNYS